MNTAGNVRYKQAEFWSIHSDPWVPQCAFSPDLHQLVRYICGCVVPEYIIKQS